MKKRVIVGMSGGVDSSVAAVLLQNEGYEVVGVTFLFTEENESEDARRVCEKLNIEHHVLDYKEVFKEKIIDEFIKEYENGLTPNPCVLCNKTVKVKFLFDAMKEFNCDFIATGHYAKIVDGNVYLSSDMNKDQTYFLCQVPKEILKKLILPLEGITKDKVREIASLNDLITANKKDSTDVCFIKEGFAKFSENNIKNIPGDVIDIATNKKIGKHSGLAKYTIGQRKGLDIGGTPDRMFVVGKDVKTNTLYVCIGSDSDYLISNSCIVEDINYIANERHNSCMARFRYRQLNTNVKINWIDDNKAEVFYEGTKAVTPGQTCAFYNDNELLGGGIIKEVRKDGKKLWYL